MVNILENAEKALIQKQFANGLGYYVQTNCSVSITSDKLYRIYRPANISANTQQWGGLLLQPFVSTASPNAAIQGHSYVIKFDVKGKTSAKVNDIRWSSNAGWEYTGCNPYPTTIANNINDFNVANLNLTTWKPFVWAFTINDTIYKTCTRDPNISYHNGVNGQSYLSYRDLKFGFSYTATGEWGADLYLKNFRMYDITNLIGNHSIKQNGIVNIDNIVEEFDKASITFDNELWSNNIVEI